MGSGQILIVDDEEMVEASMRLMLISEGYKVLTCRNGKEAMKIFSKTWGNIDLVILDMIMPEMDGEETYFSMKKIDPNVKVLLLSGFSMTDGAKELMDNRALGFLEKPVLKKDLITKISQVLSLKNGK